MLLFLLQYSNISVTIVTATIGGYMRIFKTKDFTKWVNKQGIEDDSLIKAIKEIENGLVDVNYGGSLYKKRIALSGRGKSGSVRTIIAIRFEDKAFFLYGFPKNKKANINTEEEKAYKVLAKKILRYSDKEIMKHIKSGVFIEIGENDEQ